MSTDNITMAAAEESIKVTKEGWLWKRGRLFGDFSTLLNRLALRTYRYVISEQLCCSEIT